MNESKARQLARLAEELSEAAKQLGFEVRREKILREVGYRVRGGACRFRERTLVILDREMPPAEQVEILVQALRTRDADAIYLSPVARHLLEAAAAQS